MDQGADEPSAVGGDPDSDDTKSSTAEGGGKDSLALAPDTETTNGSGEEVKMETKSSSNATKSKTGIDDLTKGTLTFRHHRATTRTVDGNNASSDDDYSSDDHQDQVGAIAILGPGPGTAAAVRTVDDYALQEQIAISDGDNGNNHNEDEGDLIRAELAPEVYDATLVQAVNNKDDEEDDGNKDGYRRRRILILLAIVGVAVAVGLGIGFAVGGSDSEPPNNNDASTLSPTMTDPYSEAVAFRGRNKDWNCTFETNSVDFLGGGAEDYTCLFQAPSRNFTYPYADYNNFFYCECPDGPIDEINLPTNDRCDCVVWFTDYEFPCLWTHFVESNDTEFFQITFDCFNVFANFKDETLDKSCVGRDPQGNCISNTDIPRPLTPAIQTGNFQDLTCLNTTYENQAGLFPLLRGRYQCNSPLGFPIPDTLVITSLFCTEEGYFDENDCNCAVFLWTQNLEFACQSCEVIRNGSNETYQLAYDCSEWFDGDCVGYTTNGTCIDSSDRPEVCTYYDIESCRDKALELGLWLGGAGFTFAGDFITKGCQFYQSDHPVYGNRAYFGTGAYTTLQLETTPVEGNDRLECDTVLDDPPATQVCELLDAQSCSAMAESRGLPAGNELYPFTSTTYIPGCHYYLEGTDPSRANTAFFGDLRDNPLEIFQIPINGPNRFFCNVTSASNDVGNVAEFANSTGLLPP